MVPPGPTLLLGTLRRLLRRNATTHILRVVAKARQEDVAETLRFLAPTESRTLLELLLEDAEQAAQIVQHVPAEFAIDLLEPLTSEQIAGLLEHYPADDAADLLEALPDELRQEVLSRLSPADAEDVEELLTYGADTAGGIMSTDFMAISVDSTCAEAIQAVQEEDAEVVFYLYTVNSEGILVGVLSLRQIVVNGGDVPVKTIMNSDVVRVRVDRDQEDVARMVARYDLLAVPVVDEFNKLVGVITVDDVIDVIREEATEDIMKMVGAANPHGSSTGASMRARLPWIGGAMTGGLATATIIGAFEEAPVYLIVSAFIPVVIGLAGNVGIQSATVVVRGLATGEVAAAGWRQILRRELSTGLGIALICGVVVGIYSHFSTGHGPRLGVVVGSSLLCVMAIAICIGTLFPLVVRRFNVDPAVATGPVLTAMLDLIGVSIFLGAAAWLLS